MSILAGAQVINYPVEVVIELSRVLLPNGVDFLNDFIRQSSHRLLLKVLGVSR